MSALFRAVVVDKKDRQVRIRLAMISAEARAFWGTRDGALWLLLEPIFLGKCPLPEAIAAVVPRPEIDGWDGAALSHRVARVVTGCTIERVTHSVPDHVAELASLSPEELSAKVADPSRMPTATIRIRVRDPRMLDHLEPGLTWDSVGGRLSPP